MKTLLLLLAFQDDTAKAKELLEAAGKALKEAKAIRFEYASQWKGTVDQKCKVTFQRPNLGRLEIKAYDQEYLYILDGKTLWMYMPSSKQYMKMEQSEGIQNALGVGPLSNLYFSPATELLTDATDLKVKEEKLGEEKVSVISWKATEAEHRLWIDANKAVRKYELKMTVEDETYEQTIEYGKVEIDPKLEKDAFAFTPPKDATEFKQDDDPSGALIAVGEDAPDFEATDLEGKKVKLSDYKGKTVILNFWFYGWGACREEFPHLQKIYDGVKDKNVVVLAVNLSDSKEQIQKYFDENKFTMKPVMQMKDEISARYGVSAYPTNYVVGPDGKVAFRSVGFEEGALKAAIEKTIQK